MFVWPRLGDLFFMSKTQRSLCVSFSSTGSKLHIYHLFVWWNLNVLHIFLWITLSTQSCLVLYSFCANLMHSLIMWLIDLSLLPHYLHFLFRCILSSLALIWLVLMTLFCAAVRIDTVSLLMFPFLCNINVFLWVIFVCRLKRPWICFSSQNRF